MMLNRFKTALSNLARRMAERLRLRKPAPQQPTQPAPEPPPLSAMARLRAKLRVNAWVRSLKKRVEEERLRALEHKGNRHERRAAQSILYRHRSHCRPINPRQRVKIENGGRNTDKVLKLRLAKRRMLERKHARRAINLEAKKARRLQRLTASLRSLVPALDSLIKSSREAAAKMQTLVKTRGPGHIFVKQGDSYVYLGEAKGGTLEERKAA